MTQATSSRLSDTETVILNLEADICDPIVPAIEAYLAGLAKFSDVPDENSDEMTHLWKDPWQVLVKWDQPCRSRGGAIAALKLALWEDDIGDSQLPTPLMKAVLSYIEGEL